MSACWRASLDRCIIKNERERGRLTGSSFENEVQASGAFFPQSHFPQITGILIGVFRDIVERERRRLTQYSRHILRRQRDDEGREVVRSGAVGEAQMAAYVALRADQFESLGHLALPVWVGVVRERSRQASALRCDRQDDATTALVEVVVLVAGEAAVVAA
jgi:hypothetical protein